MAVILLSASLFAASGLGNESYPTTHIPGLGVVKGNYFDNIDEYLGIPYGEDTTGNNRWKAPLPKKPWAPKTFAATTFGDTCPGSGCTLGIYDSEDCLHLNLFKPSGSSSNLMNLPVMIWIHGGGFAGGCSNEFAGGSIVRRSLKEGNPVIVVTINYRLNAFGFLGSSFLKDKDGSMGNFGFQDQRLAMIWVKKHIAAFGGNPNHVTIFGESAGAGSVSNHLVAHRSFGLYNKAIAESGMGAVWAAKPLDNAEAMFEHFCDLLNCSGTGEQNVTCLKSKTTSELKAAVNLIPAVPSNIFIAWSPVVDGVEFDLHPWRLVQSPTSRVHNVDIIAGVNRDEYSFFFLSDGYPYANATQSDFNYVLSPYVPNDDWLPELASLYQVQEYEYPSNLRNYSFWWWAAMRAKSDHEFTCPSRRTLMNLQQSNQNSYSYFFIHPTETDTGIPGTGSGAFVVPHGSEIGYVYNCSTFTPECNWKTAAEAQLAEDMSGFWTSFGSGSTLPLPWSKYNPLVDNSIVIDVEKRFGGVGFTNQFNHRKAQCDFWDKVLAANNP